MNSISNFYQVSDLMACAGQPHQRQLASIAAHGYKAVINLGLADGKYALKDEAASVMHFGMAYHHIPVIFEEPKIEDLDLFIKVMDTHANEKTFIHCAANYRASVFTGLYLLSANRLNEDGMHQLIGKIWQPDPVWKQFIEKALEFLKWRG